jgi:anti-sigma regulatory factor (Ser/Thr protein kinase)
MFQTAPKTEWEGLVSAPISGRGRQRTIFSSADLTAQPASADGAHVAQAHLDSTVLTGSRAIFWLAPSGLAGAAAGLAKAVGCSNEVSWLFMVLTGVGAATGLGYLHASLRRLSYNQDFTPRSLRSLLIRPLVTGMAVAGGIVAAVGCLTAQAGEPLSSVQIIALAGTLFGGLAAAFFYFSGGTAVRAYHRSTIALGSALRDAKLEVHRARIDPHFVFNTLNAALADLEQDRHAGMRALERMERHFRYGLKHRHRRWVGLGEEFDAAVDLLRLEQLRFPDALHIESSMDEAARAVKVPVMILQPLVENAVKHGRNHSPESLCIRLSVTASRHEAQIRISNTGDWNLACSRLADQTGGTGLEGVRYRLRTLYGRPQRMDVVALDGWVHVTITLPRESGRIEAPIL